VKIIDSDGMSDFYDYSHAGIDEHVVFHRNGLPSQPLNIDDFPFDPKLSPFEGGLGASEDDVAPYSLGYVFVAGDVYPMVMVDHIPGYAHEDISLFDNHRWSLVHVQHNDFEFFYDGRAAMERLEASLWFQKARKTTQDRARTEMHDHFHTQKPEWKDWLARYGIVIGVMHRVENKKDRAHESEFGFDHHLGVRTLINSACLKDVRFQDVLDPFTLNQNIARYVSGVLPAMANPMVEISDPDKIKKGGFDPKMGFRKRPEGAS
jgi:hypothetical protein